MSTPIVLIHGLIGHLNDPVIHAAFNGAQMHAPHLIGYGDHSDTPVSTLALTDQAKHVANYITGHGLGRIHLVGHSVGGAVAMLVAHLYPDCVASLTSVEGNFTLKDAFWSAGLAEKQDREVKAVIAGFRADPDAWIAGAGVPVNEWTSQLARSWLDHQPALTVKAQARAVVEATTPPAYLEAVRELMGSDLPCNLVAGEKSVDGWDVPDWANELATRRIDIPGAGHLMMAENPKRFAEAILLCCEEPE